MLALLALVACAPTSVVIGPAEPDDADTGVPVTVTTPAEPDTGPELVYRYIPYTCYDGDTLMPVFVPDHRAIIASNYYQIAAEDGWPAWVQTALAQFELGGEAEVECPSEGTRTGYVVYAYFE